MSRLKTLHTIILTAGMFLFSQGYGAESDFRINQLGYYPAANKIVPVLFTKDSTFELLDTSGKTVYTGNLSKIKIWKNAKDSVKQADFSTFTDEGMYRLKVTDKGTSYPFTISKNVLSEISNASLKTFYFQRSFIPLLEKYAGVYARSGGHLSDTAARYHESTGYSGTEATFYGPGGWYDAGDYGKYVTNAGITVGTLLSFYESFGVFFGDSALNIPESGNKRDDLLDEVKFELDWLKCMQDTDGSVFHKLTSLQHASMARMPGDDQSTRFVIGRSVTATLDFAAVMAMAGRIYKDDIPEYAEDCVNRAEKAYQWAVANPDSLFLSNPLGVGTGDYADDNASDEFIWAAAELFITTGKDVYKDKLSSSNLAYTYPPDWKTVKALAPLSLATVANDLAATRIKGIKDTIVICADKYLSQMSTHAYRLPNLSFYWGSNSLMANMGICLVYAYQFTKKAEYIKGAAEIVDYLLGKNATGYSFVTGFGSLSPVNIHHRPSIGDTVKAPVPALLVGGPNGSCSTYVDATASYETNEVAINWNSPLTFLCAAVQKVMSSPELAAGIRKNNRSNIHKTYSQMKIQRQGFQTKISLSVNNPKDASLKIFDIQGKLKKDLSASLNTLSRRNHSIVLDNIFAAGIYVIRYKDGANTCSQVWTNTCRNK